MDEDCLRLDIIVPVTVTDRKTELRDHSRKPILIWFSNDEFRPRSDGSVLATRGDMIIVKVNYRVGVLGFLTTGFGSEVPGNAGLMDQQLALEWVQRNIWDFGGDGNRVTLYGERGGLGTTSLHLYLEYSQPYFHRAIIPNDVSMPWNLPESSVSEAKELAYRAGCNLSMNLTSITQIVSCLRSLSVEELIQISYELEVMVNNKITWGPVKDGVLFPATAYISSEYVIDSQNIMLGVESWNDLNIVGTLIGRNDVTEGVSQREYNRIVSDISDSFNLTKQSPIIFSAIQQTYNNWEDPTSPISRAHSTLSLLYGWNILYPVYEFLTVWSQDDNDSCVYLFVYDSEALGQSFRLFDLILGEEQSTDMSDIISQNLISYWSNFVKQG